MTITTGTYQIEDTGNGIYVWHTSGKSLGPIEAAKVLADRLWDTWDIADLQDLVDQAETDFQFEGHEAVRFNIEGRA